MILAIYATFEQMHGRKSTVEELIHLLKRFSRESVLYLCAISGIVLKLWERGGWGRPNYDVLVTRSSSFAVIGTSWLRGSMNLSSFFTVDSCYF
jgi:hypothetical protein